LFLKAGFVRLRLLQSLNPAAILLASQFQLFSRDPWTFFWGDSLSDRLVTDMLGRLFFFSIASTLSLPVFFSANPFSITLSAPAAAFRRDPPFFFDGGLVSLWQVLHYLWRAPTFVLTSFTSAHPIVDIVTPFLAARLHLLSFTFSCPFSKGVVQ